jgi:hypothetical protein
MTKIGSEHYCPMSSFDAFVLLCVVHRRGVLFHGLMHSIVRCDVSSALIVCDADKKINVASGITVTILTFGYPLFTNQYVPLYPLVYEP